MAIRDIVLKNKAFQILKEYYDNKEKALLELKAKHKMIIGTMGCDVPDEIIIAAGAFPVRIHELGVTDLTKANEYLEKKFDPVLRHQFQKLVDGTYADLIDHLVISQSSDSFIRVYFYLRELYRNHPDYYIPPLTFIDWQFDQRGMRQMRNCRIIERFKKEVETWIGHPINDKELLHGIAVCNEDRQALREFGKLRRAEECRITGTEAQVVIGSSLFMEKEKHAALVRELVEEAKDWPVINAKRIYATGTYQPDLELYSMIEELGGNVVGEDTDWGDRHYNNDVVLCGDRTLSIVNRYFLRLPSQKKCRITTSVKMMLEEVADSKASGVLYYMNLREESASWNTPAQKEAFSSIGIASAEILKQNYPVSAEDREKQRDIITTLLAKCK